MVSKKLVSYIKSSLEKGFSNDEIMKKLQDKGYSKTAINAAFSTNPQKKSFNPKYLIIGVTAVIVIAIVVLLVLYLPKNEPEKSSAPKTEGTNIQPGTEVKQEIPPQSEETKAVNVQEVMDGYKEECLKDYKKRVHLICEAFIESNISKCEQATSKMEIEKCKGSFYTSKAFLSNDISQCENIKEEYAHDYYIFCKGAINKDISICQGDPDCIAQMTQDISKCEEEKDPLLREDCKNIVLITLAQLNDDDSFCDMINDRENKEVCIGYINKVSCMTYSEEICSDLAYLYAFEMTREAGLCDKIVNQTVKTECLDVFYSNNNECEKINELSVRNGCYSRRDYQNYFSGVRKKDKGICESITNYEIKKACMSVIDNNLKLCKSVQEPQFKLFCLTQFAEETGDVSLCNEMADEEGIQRCRISLGIA